MGLVKHAQATYTQKASIKLEEESTLLWRLVERVP
jgi:hypothetical protein